MGARSATKLKVELIKVNLLGGQRLEEGIPGGIQVGVDWSQFHDLEIFG